MDILALAEINGVSGCEAAVRRYIISQIEKYADDITVDSMGNVIAYKRGNDSSKTLAAMTHMDENGLIISQITDKGYLKFKQVGQTDPRKLVSKKVVVGNGVKGVIGMKAIHLQTRTERENVVEASKLFIDIGAKSKEEAEKYVKLGDYAAFLTKAERIGENIKGKALDRSGGCAALIDAFKDKYPYDVYACFLAQHEVGARGAKIVTHRIAADAILTVTSAETADMYPNPQGEAMLGKGVVIAYADKSVIADRRLTDFMREQACAAGIPFSIKTLESQMSDTGAIQYNAGTKSCILAAIPCRYSHSPVSIMSKNDILSMTNYIKLFLNKIGEVL